MLSHHHKCIFVHIPKCGGTSIEHVFTQALGLKWKHRAPLLLRVNDASVLGPPRLAHLTAMEYIDCGYVPQEMFDEYFKFTFVRNPWARAVSIFHSTAMKRYPDFLSFVKDRFTDQSEKGRWFAKPQTDFFFDEEGKPIVDFIGRLETINDDFAEVANHLGLDVTLLKHRNKTKQAVYRKAIDGKSSKPSYQAFYNDESYDIVTNYYRQDIELLDYQFDSHS